MASNEQSIDDLLNDAQNLIDTPINDTTPVETPTEEVETTVLPTEEAPATEAPKKPRKPRASKARTVADEVPAPTTDQMSETLSEVTDLPPSKMWDGDIVLDWYLLNVYQKLPKNFLKTIKEGRKKDYIPVEVYRSILKEMNRVHESLFGTRLFWEVIFDEPTVIYKADVKRGEIVADTTYAYSQKCTIVDVKNGGTLVGKWYSVLTSKVIFIRDSLIGQMGLLEAAAFRNAMKYSDFRIFEFADADADGITMNDAMDLAWSDVTLVLDGVDELVGDILKDEVPAPTGWVERKAEVAEPFDEILDSLKENPADKLFPDTTTGQTAPATTTPTPSVPVETNEQKVTRVYQEQLEKNIIPLAPFPIQDYVKVIKLIIDEIVNQTGVDRAEITKIVSAIGSADLNKYTIK